MATKMKMRKTEKVLLSIICKSIRLSLSATLNRFSISHQQFKDEFVVIEGDTSSGR